MTTFVIACLLISICITFPRMIKGPTIPDRITAADSIGIMFFSFITILAYLYQSSIFLDVAMVYAILLFADVLIMAKYLDSKEVNKDD